MNRFGIFILVTALSFLNHIIGYDLAVVSMFRDEAPYLKEWIEYHRLVGVQHFRLYCDYRSDDNWKEVLQPYIDEGLLEVVKNWFVPGDYYAMHIAQQCSANMDAIQHLDGQAEWIAFIDIDEFLLPMKEKTVPECLRAHFSNADAVYVNWRNFGTSDLYIPKGEPILCQLYGCSLKSHSKNSSGKTIVRTRCARPAHSWSPHFCPLQEGYFYVNGSCESMGWLLWTADGAQTPAVDGKHHGKYLRINHYSFRDEQFFLEKRMKPAILGEREYTVDLLKEQHNSFSIVKDYTIEQFLRKNYPETYQSFWEPYSRFGK